jgi:DNA-binding transcriptional MocR family regulator
MTDVWLPDLSRSQGAKYLAIADALGAAIARGQLQAGDRLPPQRDLAAKLGVDLTTITKAYDAARSRDLIEARGRAGSFVRSAKRVAQPEQLQTDSGMNTPPDLPNGLVAEELCETIVALLRNGPSTTLQYQPAGGAPHDRAVAASMLSDRGLRCVDEQVVITAGGQNALHAILGAAVAPGSAIACGKYVYPGFRGIAERLGLRLVPLPELTGAALDEACTRETIAAIYVVPTNDNPTAHTLSAQRREELAKVAVQRGIQIIEDDAYGPLAADPLPTIASLAPDCCWHVASTSKIISPSLRVAHVRAPSVGAALRLAVDVHETAIMAPPLNAAAVSSWIEDGTFASLLAAMRVESESRQKLAGEMLAGLDFTSHAQGYHLWLRLPAGLQAGPLIELMRPAGVSVIDANRFSVGRVDEEAVRVSLGGSISADRLTRALRLLQGYVAAPAMRASAFV